ncbi:hypothetical protein C2845_PM07G26960 [Panicum miliaceum]|uniref:Uncharacterized protein n=1 Tax=Panicum miliaceum TaxID=4540 RepID=A0A3L6SH77_PANMI|nr:hypothetical protein C2845_PM07G26960 [Panicum miliaceum]
MARKKSKNFIDLDSSQECDIFEVEDDSDSESDNQIDGVDESDYTELKILKRKLVATLHHEWLLDGVKSFNLGKSLNSGTGGTLGGCLYYLCVMYLDYVDFGVCQVSNSIPRIYVWKDGMIKNYAKFDLKSPGCYGYHPLLDVSLTCHSKELRFLYNPQLLILDPEFNDKLEEYSGCKLPESLKTNISKLIQRYCFNCGVCVNLDANSISSMPDVMKSTLSKLLNHAYSIDSRAQKFVLDLVKLISHAFDDEDVPQNSVGTPPTHPGNHEQVAEGTNQSGCSKSQHFDNHDVGHSVHCSQYQVHRGNHVSSTPYDSKSSQISAPSDNVSLPFPKLSRPVSAHTPSNVDNQCIARVMEKLSKKNDSSSSQIHKTPPKFVSSPSGNALNQTLRHRNDNGNSSTPFGHLEEVNVVVSKKLKKTVSLNPNLPSQNDVIMLDNENFYVPYSVSPSLKPGFCRFFSQQAGSDKENLSSSSTQVTPIIMQTIDFTPHSTPRKSQALYRALQNSSSRFNSQSALNHTNGHG